MGGGSAGRPEEAGPAKDEGAGRSSTALALAEATTVTEAATLAEGASAAYAGMPLVGPRGRTRESTGPTPRCISIDPCRGGHRTLRGGRPATRCRRTHPQRRDARHLRELEAWGPLLRDETQRD